MSRHMAHDCRSDKKHGNSQTQNDSKSDQGSPEKKGGNCGENKNDRGKETGC